MQDLILQYGHLRLLVSFLGEKAQANWWSTSFFEPTSQFFLEPVFSKTARLAQYNGVREAARQLHDKYIGIGNVVHLFRLPEETEQDLQKLILEAPSAWFVEISNWDMAFKGLNSIAEESVTVTEGPQSVGSSETFYQISGPRLLAQYYLGAFKQGIHTFPYFVCKS